MALVYMNQLVKMICFLIIAWPLQVLVVLTHQYRNKLLLEYHLKRCLLGLDMLAARVTSLCDCVFVCLSVHLSGARILHQLL